MRERANREILLIAAGLLVLCLAKGYAKQQPRIAGSELRGAGGFFELVRDVNNFLAPVSGLADAGQISRSCPDEKVSAWDRVEVDAAGCRIIKGGASGFARLAMGERISLNAATGKELEIVTGIGEKRAENIIDLREKMGGFSNFEQLEEFKWFKPGMRTEMERFFKVD
jgi:competence ComEA-like helix-hairpin-helix protein